jgi:CHASE3 domain sensor protein
MSPLGNFSSDLAARRRAANRRLGWSLAVVAIALFVVTLFLHA